jgi:pyroglutamyl-peptidase
VRRLEEHLATAAPAEGRRITVLLTGFGPFPGAPFNPTEALVAALSRMRRPGLAEVKLVTHVFRTSYAAVDAEFAPLIERHRPDVVLMFGLAARTRHIRIETLARNARSALLPDVGGVIPADRAVSSGGSHALRGKAPFVQLVAAGRRARVDTRSSCNAGRYLCNYLYWRAVELEGPKAPAVVVFVHVPSVSLAAQPRSGASRRVTLPDLVRAGEQLLRTAVRAARLRRG